MLPAVSAGMTVQVAPKGGISPVMFADGRVWQLGGRSLLTDGDRGSPSGSGGSAVTGADRRGRQPGAA